MTPGGGNLSPSVKGFLANTANRSSLTNQYLLRYTNRVWHVFSPRLSAKYLQYDYSFKTAEGKYLLLTGGGTNDRGIVLTERYTLDDHKGYICLSFAVYIADRAVNSTILEVYQGESANQSFGLKLWDIRRPTKGWEVFTIKAAPIDKATSKDLFFYLVGTVASSSNYIALDEVSVLGDCSNPSNFIPGTAGVTTVAPATNEFVCSNGKRIPASQKCDWHKNCPNGEDEAKMICGSCDFVNHNLCQYEVLSSKPLFI